MPRPSTIDRLEPEKAKAAYDSTTIEQRKTFIAGLHKGLTVGDAKREAGISFDAAMAVWKKNTRVVKLERLLSVDEVK